MEEVVSEAGAASCWRSGSVACSRPPQLLLNWRRRSVSVGGPPPLTPHSPAQILPRPVASQGRDCGPLGLQSPVIVMTESGGLLMPVGAAVHSVHPHGTEAKLGMTPVQFSCSVMSDSLRPHESQHARPPCPSPTPGVYPNSCPLSW